MSAGTWVLLLAIGAAIAGLKIALAINWLIRYRRMSPSERKEEIRSLNEGEVSGWGA